MTDVIQAGIEKKGIPFDGGLPSPPPPSENDPVDVLTRHIDRPIEGSSDEENVRAATAEVRKRREEAWERGEGSSDDFADPVVLERRYDGRDHEPKSLKQATKDLSDQHWIERPETEI